MGTSNTKAAAPKNPQSDPEKTKPEDEPENMEEGEEEEEGNEEGEDDEEETPTKKKPQSMRAQVQAAIAAERSRVAAITARCTQVNMSHLAQALIDTGADLAACNAAIVDEYVAKGGPEIRQTTEAQPRAQDSAANAAESRAIEQRLFAQVSGKTTA